jgi:hypothetical protein
MHGSEKGFHYLKKVFSALISPKTLVKQILTPPLVPMPDQPHQLPRGMQRERPRPPRQFKSRLFRRPVALAVIATVTARDQVLPRRAPAPRSRHNMVQRQLRTRKNPPTELAGIPVPQQNVFPRKRAALLRNVPIGKQPNYRRDFVRMRRRMHFGAMHFLRLRNSLKEQHHGPANRRHIDGLIRRIQHEHRLLHQRGPPRQYWVVGSTVRGIRGLGRTDATRFGGIPPSEIARLWPVCAHRATLNYLSYRLPLSGAGRGFLAARATVSASTDLAPDTSNALAHASSVRPSGHYIIYQ